MLHGALALGDDEEPALVEDAEHRVVVGQDVCLESGQTTGPRFGSFAVLYGLDETRALIGSAEVFMGGSLCNVGGSAPVANR